MVCLENISDDFPDGQETARVTHERLSNELSGMVAQYNMTHSAGKAIWDWVFVNSSSFERMKHSSKGKSYATVRRGADKRGPRVIVKCTHRHLLEDRLVNDQDFKFPKKKYKDSTTWQLRVESAEGTIHDLKKLHLSRHAQLQCPCQAVSASFSVDGVPESKQNSVDILSLIFDGCRTVYTVKVFKKQRNFDLTPDMVLSDFIRQCQEENIKVLYNIFNEAG
jgi:hypothetical protein